jgi:hypothetical protein
VDSQVELVLVVIELQLHNLLVQQLTQLQLELVPLMGKGVQAVALHLLPQQVAVLVEMVHHKITVVQAEVAVVTVAQHQEAVTLALIHHLKETTVLAITAVVGAEAAEAAVLVQLVLLVQVMVLLAVKLAVLAASVLLQPFQVAQLLVQDSYHQVIITLLAAVVVVLVHLAELYHKVV